MPLATFARHFAERFPALLGSRVLVALSGGPDSVALLHLLADPELRLTLEAAHVHHGYRGVEADRDAEFCRCLCAGLGLPFHLLRLPTLSSPAEGREGAWRRLRYAALLELARGASIETVATGHQRDDVAEGVLVQLLRGGGPRALAGIAASTPAGVIRPLLRWPRSEILAWLGARGLEWREDSSNRDLAHTRNLVRHDLLPRLEALSPGIRGHLVTLADALAADDSFLAAEAAQRAPAIDPWHPDGGIEHELVRALPTALRSRWLHAQAARNGLPPITRRQLELAGALLDSGTPRAVALGRRWRLRLARRRLWLEPPEPPASYRLELGEEETVPLPVPTWAIRVVSEGRPDASDTIWSWQAPAGAALSVRSGCPDDLVGPERRRLGRILARRLPRHLRPAWPLVCVGDTIAWIPGVWDEVPAPGGGCVVEVLRR